MKRSTFFSPPKHDRIKVLFITASFFAILLLLTVDLSFGQIIQVNPDGTHTLILPSDTNTAVQVNPDGTHTIIIDHGSTKSYFNSDGTLSTMLNADTNNPILLNPDGTFTQYIRTGNTELRFNPDGTYCTYLMMGTNTTPTSTHKAVKKSKSRVKAKNTRRQ